MRISEETHDSITKTCTSWEWRNPSRVKTIPWSEQIAFSILSGDFAELSDRAKTYSEVWTEVWTAHSAAILIVLENVEDAGIVIQESGKSGIEGTENETENETKNCLGI